jgi:hypothetical protein
MHRIPRVLRYAAVNLQVLSLALFLFVVCTAHAQIAGTGNIEGSVSDSTGAAIADASVTLTEESTQVTQTTTTDRAGVYVFPNTKIGTYTVTVTAPSFQTYAQKGNVLEVGSSISINVKMKVGATTEHVEVQSEAIALQTEDVSFKQTVDQQDITELPLNSPSRQITGLLAMSGGETSAPAGDFTGSKYSYQTISVSIAGGQGNTTLWRLDGGDNNDYMANGNLPFPFPDAVSQFSVESTALGAQDGMHSGGMVNVVTRSGTNKYHGAAFEFIRNNYVDATNFFVIPPNGPGSGKDQLHQNQFGGTFGGPIKRDKLFAFAGYQRLISKQNSAKTSATVPTAANLAGDFSTTDPTTVANGGTGVTNACSTKLVTLLDPLTGAKLPGNKYNQAGGPTLPAWNAQALALQKLLPVINPAIDPNNCGIVNYSIPQDVYDNEFVTRVDYNVNAKNNLFGRYFLDGYQAPAFYFPTNILVTTASGNIERTQSYTFGEIYSHSAGLINSAHLTVLRRVDNRGYNANDINAATGLGVTLYQAVPNGLQLSEGKFTIGGGTNSVAHFNDNTLAIDDEVTWVKGQHQIVFGGEFVRNQLNINNGYESNGTFTFNGQYSGSGPNGGTTIGDQTLDYLRGALSAFQQSKFQQNALRGSIPSLYFQDTFHATSGLTVVAGLRWSPEYEPTDYFNRGVVFSQSALLANQVSTVYPNAPAGALFYGDKGVPRAFTQNSIWQFSPNVGVAWDPNGSGKWALRAGAELIYDEVNFFTSQRNQQNPPYSTAISETQTSTSGPISFSAPWSAGTLTTSPFPQPQIPTPATAQFFAQSQYIVDPVKYHPSYTTQWTASIQHQFGHGWEAQLDYIGNKTTHVPMGLPLSPAIFVPGVWGAGGTGCTGVVVTGPYAGKTGAAGTPCSTTANQAQRFLLTQQNPVQGNQYLGGGGGSVLASDNGTANYNGLISTLQHRLSSSFSLLMNETWSKCLNEEDAQGDLAGTTVENPNNPALDYGPCGSDYRHVFNTALITKSNFSFGNGLEKALINNWEFVPGMHVTSGAPFTVTAAVDNSFTDVGNDRPNLIPGVPVYLNTAIRSLSGSTNRSYLNPAAFCSTATQPQACTTPVGAGTYGNVGRNSFRGKSQFNLDAQVSRIFPIYERLSMTARLEAFNVLNHPNFSTPTASTSSSTFGQIGSQSNAARVFQGSIKVNF